MAKTKDNKKELEIIRIFDAPVEKVWKAWSDAVEFRKWWGPKGFIAPFSKIDFCVGGKYLSCMQSELKEFSYGKKFWNTGTFKEIVPMKKIVYTDSFCDSNGKKVPASTYGLEGDFPEVLTVTVLFEEQNGKTKMTLTHVGLPKGKMSEMTGQGWNESFDKMVESLKG